MATSVAELQDAFHTFADASSRLEERYAALTEEVTRLRKRLAEQDQRLAMQEQLATLGELAGTLAHEVRTPLAAMTLYVSLLEEDLKGTRNEELIISVKRSVHTLEHTVNNMLLLAKGEKLVRVPMNITAVVAEKVQEFSSKFPEITFDAQLSEQALILGNDVAIRQIVHNLFANAAQALSAKGKIAVSVQREGPITRLCIKDSGPGISEDVLPRLFEPLVSSKQTGHGLGLAVVRRLLEQHKARVTVTSDRGQGALFEIEFGVGGS